MPHRSTLARSTANGKVRTIVTGPGPGSPTATPAEFSRPLTDTRTTLPGRRRGDAAVGAAVNRDVPAVGVGDPSLTVELVPHADTTTITAMAAPLIPPILRHVRFPVMRVAAEEVVRLGGVAGQRVPAAHERVVLAHHRDVIVVNGARNATWVLRFDGAYLRAEGIELRLEREGLRDARIRRGRWKVGETQGDHLTVAEAIRAAQHCAEAHARDGIGHQPVLVHAVETGTRFFRRPVPGVVRVRSVAAPNVTELVKRDGDVVLDRPHPELRV